MTKNFCEKEFSSKNDTKHSPFMILGENFALFMGSYFKILPCLWGRTSKFCPVYGVVLQNFALFMGSYFKILPCLSGRTSKFCPGNGYLFSKFCPVYGVVLQNFALVMGTYFQNFALFMGSYFKILPWLWVLIFKMLPGLWVLTLISQRHIYTRPPIGVTPPPSAMIHCIFKHIDSQPKDGILRNQEQQYL